MTKQNRKLTFGLNILVFLVVTLFAALSASTISFGETPQRSAPSTTTNIPADAVVATYNHEKITLDELDASLKQQLNALEQQKYELRRQAVEQTINDKLVEQAAANSGMTKQQYLKTNVDDKIPQPPDSRIQQIFDQSKPRLPQGAKIEDYRDRIIKVVNRQAREEQLKKLYADLQKAANVQINLQPPPKPRVDVAATGPSRGPNDAKVTIVEFSDFQCPYCRSAHETVAKLMQTYPDKVRLVFREFPLAMHQNAEKAAEAALCAQDQGKFWELHDAMFANQAKLNVADLKDDATKLGMNADQFGQCIESGKKAPSVAQDVDAGKKAGVSGTPGFFINGIFLSGAQPFDQFKNIVDQELAAK